MSDSGLRTLRFTARLAPDDHGVASARLHLPTHVLPVLGGGGTQQVQGTVDGQPFASTIVSDGQGGMFLPVDQALRAKTNALPGKVVEVVLQLA